MAVQTTTDIYDPTRWGLPVKAIADLENRLRCCWERFRRHFKTKTRDNAEHGWTYLRGLLLMNTKRNYANIERRMNHAAGDGQAMQQFMSDSPWAARPLIQQVQQEIAETPGLAQGGVLLLDESAEEKAGEKSAGAGRQYNGRLGKVEMSQVGVFLAYYNPKGPVWTWIDGELYLPPHWFTPDMAEERQRVGVPADRKFATKIELGWKMIQRVQVPYEAVGMDDLYGRSGWLRRQLDQAGILYMAEIPDNTTVYLSKPDITVLDAEKSEAFPPSPEVVSGEQAVKVRDLVAHPETHFQRVKVRYTERGVLEDAFAMRRVWTVRDGQVAEEWLVIRHEHGQRYTYALSNAPADTPHERLAWLKCVRHFVECSNQTAKSETGWDEFQARKYRAWEHNLALTILATWFIAQTRYEWSCAYTRDPQLAQELELEVLPALSVANVRELLQAVMPLPQLSKEQATRLVVKYLVQRSRSLRSRLKAQYKQRGQT